MADKASWILVVAGLVTVSLLFHNMVVQDTVVLDDAREEAILSLSRPKPQLQPCPPRSGSDSSMVDDLGRQVGDYLQKFGTGGGIVHVQVGARNAVIAPQQGTPVLVVDPDVGARELLSKAGHSSNPDDGPLVLLVKTGACDQSDNNTVRLDSIFQGIGSAWRLGSVLLEAGVADMTMLEQGGEKIAHAHYVFISGNSRDVGFLESQGFIYDGMNVFRRVQSQSDHWVKVVDPTMRTRPRIIPQPVAHVPTPDIMPPMEDAKPSEAMQSGDAVERTPAPAQEAQSNFQPLGDWDDTGPRDPIEQRPVTIYENWDDPDGTWYPRFQDLQNQYCPGMPCQFTRMVPDEESARKFDAVIFHGPYLDHGHQVSPRTPGPWREKYGKPKGTTFWLFTGEPDWKFPLQADPEIQKRIDHRLSYELDVEVPMTSIHRVVNGGWDYFYLNQNKRTDADGIFISSNCAPNNNRRVWMEAIMQKMNVHSYGSCLNNGGDSAIANRIRGTGKQDSNDKFEAMGEYKFCFTMDNSNQKDYVSEKLYHGLGAGCVPVYMGTPTIERFLPHPKAVVKTADFETPEALADYLIKLANNKDEYEERLRWKIPGTEERAQGTLVQNTRMTRAPAEVKVEKILQLSQNTMACRVCRTVTEDLKKVHGFSTPIMPEKFKDK